MRRTLATFLVAAAAFAAPASAIDPLDTVRDLVGECMDCVPSRCQILNSCEALP